MTNLLIFEKFLFCQKEAEFTKAKCEKMWQAYMLKIPKRWENMQNFRQ